MANLLTSEPMEHRIMLPQADLVRGMQHRILYGTSYLGVPVQKNPLDLWVYQEMIFELRPDVIVEIGNGAGGALLYLADVCERIGCGRVMGVDLMPPPLDVRNRWYRSFAGDACEQFWAVSRYLNPADHVLVIEDSSHTYANTLACLRLYSQLVKPGGYYVVEDTICHHGLDEGPEPGPYEAVQAFLTENPDFEADRSRESFGLTWNPGGFLKRKSETKNDE